MSRLDPIDFAREFALRAHSQQEYRRRPYIYHLEAVAEIVTGLHPENCENAGFRSALRERRTVIAYLHDVIEGTRVGKASLRAIFGDHVADCVDVMSEPKGRKRKERKKIVNQWLRQIRLNSPLVDALIVKAADRLANVRNCVDEGNHSLLKMYRQEHEEFSAAARREGLCQDVWEELDSLIANQPVRRGT